MKTYQLKIMGYLFLSALFSVGSMAYAANAPTIVFFASNNTHEISAEKAYERLSGKEQSQLKKCMTIVLKNNHINHGRFGDILGMYQMASDKNMTGDNTAVFYASPSQSVSNAQAFSVAAQLSKKMNQESVAVFIPSNRAAISDVVVKFTSQSLSVPAIIKLIHDQLPDNATAFSLHVANTHSMFNSVKVVEIEWLGSKINKDEIKKAFPHESVIARHGQAYLVYKNGQVKLF